MRRWGRLSLHSSIGIGALAIFGSYIDKERSLGGEAVSVMVLDTAVAIIAGLSFSILFCVWYQSEKVQVWYSLHCQMYLTLCLAEEFGEVCSSSVWLLQQ